MRKFTTLNVYLEHGGGNYRRQNNVIVTRCIEVDGPNMSNGSRTHALSVSARQLKTIVITIIVSFLVSDT